MPDFGPLCHDAQLQVAAHLLARFSLPSLPDCWLPLPEENWSVSFDRARLRQTLTPEQIVMLVASLHRLRSERVRRHILRSLHS